MKKNLKLIALAEAACLTIYIILVALLIQNTTEWLRPKTLPPIFAITAFLLLFTTSALISATTILGYPALLFLDGKKDDALKIILWAIFWLICLLALLGIFLLTK